MAVTWTLPVTVTAYFTINVALSISNKLALQQFPYPWVLTTLHSTSTTTGCLFLLSTGHFSLTHLTSREHTTLLLFSTLFTLNIAASSLSLSIISLALHQALRSTGPIATVLIQWLLYGKRYDRHVYLSLFGMSVGIVLATAGDYECTLAGFLVTMLGVLLATLKTIATNTLMTGALKLHPLEALLRLCPLAALQSIFGAYLAGEISILAHSSGNVDPARHFVALLLISNATLALLQNLVSFHTNKVAGPITITVCANVKQVATIVLGVVMFKTKLGVMGNIGMALALGGSGWYSVVRLKSVKKELRINDRRRKAVLLQ